MSDILIRYSKKKIKFGFIYALVNILFGVIINSKLGYLWIIFGSLYLLFNYFQSKNPYLKINQESIIISNPLKKTIKLGEIIKIEYKFGDYIVHTTNKIYKINKSLVDIKDLSKFDNYFNEIKQLHKNTL